MTLFLTLLPLYVFGNLHCLGMCGPLVFLLGKHPYRHYYFFGRTAAFTLAGLIAGTIGSVVNVVLNQYHLLALTSLLFGGIIITIGIALFLGRSYSSPNWITKQLERVNRSLLFLMLKEQRWPTFLFGFFTLFLPCGQTVIAFSTMAVFGDPIAGLWNGLAFALFTSPALFFVLYAQQFLSRWKVYYQEIMGVSAVLIGVLSICRGCAQLEWINHWVLNPEAATNYHIIIY